MANYRCNMCGGTLEIDKQNSIATCEYCGTKQSLSKIDSEFYAKEQARKGQIASEYDACVQEMKLSSTAKEYEALSKRFLELEGYGDSASLSAECLDKAEIARKDLAYRSANAVLQNSRWSDVNECIRMHEGAIKAFEQIRDWKDSIEKIELCKRRIQNVKRQAREQALTEKRKIQALEEQKKNTIKKIKRIVPIVAIVAVVLTLLLILGAAFGIFFAVRALVRLAILQDSLYYMEHTEESLLYQVLSLSYSENTYNFPVSYGF